MPRPATHGELRSLIQEEAREWAAELLWDYADVAQALVTGLENGGLRGFEISCDNSPVAYGYYLLDGRRAVVGSLYAAAAHRGRGFETAILEALVQDARQVSGSRRIECQTLFCSDPDVDQAFARLGFVSRERHYLFALLPGPVRCGDVRMRPLRLGDVAIAANVIHRSHQGTVDAALNTTYTTPSQCRSFAETLMLRSGCGQFEGEASFVAETHDGPVGVILASRLSAQNGHICQVSVLPQAQGRGIGRALIARTLEAFKKRGVAYASLSVTVVNHPAYALYRKLGFAPRKVFRAHAWAAAPDRIQLTDSSPSR